MELLIKDEYANGKTLLYEKRLLRITISESLFPITDLTDVNIIAQVFVDILQCTSSRFCLRRKLMTFI